MNTALQIISMQHELVLALGSTLELKEMLRHFLHVCNSRLTLQSSHVFLYLDENKNPCWQEDSVALSHYLSLPERQNGILWAQDQNLNDLAQKAQEINEERFQCFFMGGFGVLILERDQSMGPLLQNILNPVLEKLAMSCRASINHLVLLREVDARKEAEEQMQHLAYHDEVTGLNNRASMRETLQAEISRSIKLKTSGAILFIDLNDFKSINDLMGHQIGDQILKQVAERLEQTLPAARMIARFGGDEFTVLLTGLDNDSLAIEATLKAAILNINAAIDKGFSVEKNHFTMSCSIGYDVFYPTAPKTVTEILKNADLAMYEAKRTSAELGLLYRPSMSEALDNRIAYIADIKKALKESEFELHYQPQYDQGFNIIGAEALLRWNSPTRGYVSPMEYIPIAEESDLIVEIGDWVMDQACRDIATLESLNLPDSFENIAINVSAKQLAKEDFLGKVTKTVKHHSIDAERLSIEITEGIMVGDIEHSIRLLSQLSEMGIESSIDDFGTGYSSLTYLKRLPANLIKIDRSFVTDIHKDISNQSIVTMIIQLAKNLNMATIAEGVETSEELEYLKDLGCHLYQGYFFCRPIPFEQLKEKLCVID